MVKCTKGGIGLRDVNLVTVLLVSVFFIPIIFGAFRIFSRNRIQDSLIKLIGNMESLSVFVLSVYFTKKIFFENNNRIFSTIYKIIPEDLRQFLYGQDILTYLVSVPILFIVLLLLIRMITDPVYNFIAGFLSDKLYQKVTSMKYLTRRAISALCQLPKAVFTVLLLSLVLNFSGYYLRIPYLSEMLNDSSVYQVIYQRVLLPILNSNIAKKMPVILNDSFNVTVETLNIDKDKIPFIRDIKVIEYFNGVTLDEAVKSTLEIDIKALELTKEKESDREKAKSIYDWVSQNIEYDNEKAKAIAENSMGISSGAIVAFNTRKGICFDFASLYVSMCRAAGLKVRMITGLAYSGMAWGDHAWNQVYLKEEERWINVDPTFGAVSNYFDKGDFYVDHLYGEVQGEW